MDSSTLKEDNLLIAVKEVHKEIREGKSKVVSARAHLEELERMLQETKDSPKKQ